MIPSDAMNWKNQNIFIFSAVYHTKCAVIICAWEMCFFSNGLIGWEVGVLLWMRDLAAYVKRGKRDSRQAELPQQLVLYFPLGNPHVNPEGTQWGPKFSWSFLWFILWSLLQSRGRTQYILYYIYNIPSSIPARYVFSKYFFCGRMRNFFSCKASPSDLPAC